MTLLLPWFPIVLAVGVGGRLLGRTRGQGLGILCALFWVVLVQASDGVGIWRDPWSVATIVAGAVAIVAMGRWAGECGTGFYRRAGMVHRQDAGATQSISRPGGSTAAAIAASSKDVLQQICFSLDRFDDWLEEHRSDSDPWPKFDEFVRTVLYQCCQATHVRPYRLLSEGDQLAALSEPDPLVEVERISARRGILGHVVTTGRPYVAGDETQGELVSRLAEESRLAEIAWCFAIRQSTRRLGVVVVGQLGLPGSTHKPLLDAMERLVNQFWCTLQETTLSRSSVLTCPVSGLYARSAFLRVAEESLCASYTQGEPVAVVVIALEGLRDMNDSGRWEVADDLVRAVSDALRRKVRMEDRLGRFDGSRIILLLRRVDSQLASLIAKQMISRVTTICADSARWGATATVRCGVTGSGTDQPTLRTLVSRALIQCRRARLEDLPIASDLETSNVESQKVESQKSKVESQEVETLR